MSSSPQQPFSKEVYPSEEHPLSGIWDPRPLGLAHAVAVSGPSRRIYVTGQASLNEQGELLFPGDKVKQLELCMESIQKVLESMGARLEDVVQCSILVVDYDADKDFAPLLPVWSRYIRCRMASTLYGVKSLALKGMVIEVDAIAEAPLERR